MELLELELDLGTGAWGLGPGETGEPGGVGQKERLKGSPRDW